MPQLEKNKVEEREDPMIKSEDEVEVNWRTRVMRETWDAYLERESPNPIFNNLSYSESYDQNLKRAINLSEKRKKGEEREISMGLIPEKIFGFVSIMLGYVMKRDFTIYQNDGTKIKGLGEFYNLAVEHTQRLEHLKEKKLAVWFQELYTQGDAFILEEWIVNTDTPKEAYDKDGVKVDLSKLDHTYEVFEKFEYKEGKQVQTRKAEATRLDGRKVILFDLTENDIQKQPKIVIEDRISLEEGESLYGTLERFKQVPKGRTTFTNQDNGGVENTIFSTDRLDMDKFYIRHRYFSKQDNQYNTFINGVNMLPMDTPLSLPYPRMNYPIIQLTSERVAGSAYSRSIPAKTKFNADFLDWAMKMMAQKVEQSNKPAILVSSKFTVPANMFDAGQRTEGITNNDYSKADPDNNGITSSDINFTQMMKETIEAQTLNKTSSGQASGSTSATEIGIADQAQNTRLGPFLDALVMGIMDLSLRRAETVESKFTMQKETTVVDGETIPMYQNFSINFGGVENLVDFRPEISSLTEEEADTLENDLHIKETALKEKDGEQSRIHLVDPEQIRKADYSINCVIKPEQKKETILQMIQLQNEITFLTSTFPNVDMKELQKEYSETSGRSDKLFLPSELVEQTNNQEEGGKPINTGSLGAPRLKPSDDNRVN